MDGAASQRDARDLALSGVAWTERTGSTPRVQVLRHRERAGREHHHLYLLRTEDLRQPLACQSSGDGGAAASGLTSTPGGAATRRAGTAATDCARTAVTGGAGAAATGRARTTATGAACRAASGRATAGGSNATDNAIRSAGVRRRRDNRFGSFGAQGAAGENEDRIA